MILDFKEIAQANKASGKQDDWELFSRDFLEYLGYEILSDPDRGADGGIDIKVREDLSGIRSKSYIIWLVSCKHKANSGQSVVPKDEINILERVASKGCSGFLGLYSTLASSGLTEILEGLKKIIKKQNTKFLIIVKSKENCLKVRKEETLQKDIFQIPRGVFQLKMV
ncbi:restriction endonuclease [Synechococcus moorigangaii CMS01]|nr:restriction endonuclease [Synechococcus moorigangaii CMS01]